jgi:hypothetical protein
MKKRIQEAVTFIKATRDEAITLANDIVEDAEVHALVVQSGFAMASTPVGYMVVPRKEWVGLTDEEIAEMLNYGQHGRIPEYTRNFVDAIEAKLKEKNT